MNYSFDIANTGISDLFSDSSRLIQNMSGQGDISLSNCYLGYFASDRWQMSQKIPTLLKNYLSLSANLTGAGSSMPLIKELMKEINLKMPREITTSLELKNGSFNTREIYARTPLGTLHGKGSCAAEGDLDYTMKLTLAEPLKEKYGDNPLLEFFTNNDQILFPMKLTGTLSHPKVDLDLTDDQRAEFEERAIEVITEFVQRKLARERGEEGSRIDTHQLEKTIRSLIRKLF